MFESIRQTLKLYGAYRMKPVLTSSAATSRLTTLSRRRNIRLFRSSICRWREYCHMTTSSTAIAAIR